MNPEDVKSKTIQFRVTAGEHQALKGAADAAGESLSSWLLRLGLKAAERAKKRR